MATIAKGPMRWAYRKGGGSRDFAGGPEQPYVKEAASQNYKKGDLLYLGSGIVTECGADPALIYAQAEDDATGVTGAQAFVAPIHPDDVFIANVSTTTAAGDFGTEYGIAQDSDGVWIVDKGDTTAKRVRVIGFFPEDLLGDTYGRVYCCFLPRQAAGDSAVGTVILQG